MKLHPLIHRASTTTLTPKDLEQAAAQAGVSLGALCDAFAREVAEGYLLGEYSWAAGDAAMNGLYACVHVAADFGFPEFARQVFTAFDEGEYVHPGTSPELDGEPRTKMLLALCLGKSKTQ